MSNQIKLSKILWIMIGIAAIAAVAVFAIVGNQLPQPKNATGKSQEHIVKPQSTWDVTFTSSFGKKAPDFSIEDINGKTHKLNEYLGRNVMVVFWITWCPACNLEIPHLRSRLL